MKISNINWGDDSAEKDPNLLHYFVSQEAIERLERKQTFSFCQRSMLTDIARTVDDSGGMFRVELFCGVRK